MIQQHTNQYHKKPKSTLRSHQNQESSCFSDNCPLCNEACIHILISSALFNKHTSSHNFYYTKDLDDIIDQAPCQAVIRHKQNIALDEDQEFLRRFYKQNQYENKNKAISEYYKFHHDYPKLHQLGVDRILEKYYDRKKQHDYKKIKRILKEEEDISITTQKSSTIVSVDEELKKSRYSNILGDLDNQDDVNDNESQVLKKICDKIGKAYDKRAMSPFLNKKKSIFSQNNNISDQIESRKFKQYLKKQELKLKQQSDSIKNSLQNSVNQKQKQSKKYQKYTTSKQTVSSIGSKKLQSTIKNTLFYDGKPYVSGSSNNTYHRFVPPHKNNQQLQKFGNQNIYGNIKKFDQIQFQVNNQTSKINLKTHNAFKRNKQPNLNMYGGRDSKNESTKITVRRSKSRSNINSKQKFSQKTTQDIYKNAAQQLRNGKRSSSFNSLVSKQQSQRNSFSNLLIKQKSQFGSSKFLKQKNIMSNNQDNILNFNTKVSRAKSTNNLNRYQPHQFYQEQEHKQQTRKIKLNSTSLKNLKIRSSSNINQKFLTHKIDTFNTISKDSKAINLFTDVQIQNQNSAVKTASRSKQFYRSSKQKQSKPVLSKNIDCKRKSECKNPVQQIQAGNIRSKINIDNILQRKLFLQPAKGVIVNKLFI